MGNDLHRDIGIVVPADKLPHLGHAVEPVPGCDVIQSERAARGPLQVDACPIVEQPDVVVAVDEELDQIRLDRRCQERAGGHAEPRGEHDGALRTAVIPGEAESRLGAG